MQAICGRVAEWQFVDICELIAETSRAIYAPNYTTLFV